MNTKSIIIATLLLLCGSFSLKAQAPDPAAVLTADDIEAAVLGLKSKLDKMPEITLPPSVNETVKEAGKEVRKSAKKAGKEVKKTVKDIKKKGKAAKKEILEDLSIVNMTADPDTSDTREFDIKHDENTEGVIVRVKDEQDRLYALRNDPKRQDGENPHWSVSLNVADGFTFGTMGISGQYTLTRNVTLEAKARYNPWTWNAGEPKQLQYRHQTYTVGARWWPWYTFSGWWVSGALQYQQYNRAGIGVSYSREGDAYGAALNAGYAVQIFPWMNVDFGLGFYTGYHKYVKYACPTCGKRLEAGEGFFILPDFITINLMFIF